MKIQWSVFYSLFLMVLLAGCGGEQFGTAPQSSSSTADALKNYSHSSCSTYTLIKPKVDVLYVVDNSSSNYYLPSDVKKSINNTVNSLSSSFDFRVIGTPLLQTSGGNEDYQVLTNSANPDGINPSKLISSSGDFNFFGSAPVSAQSEQGLERTISFINYHKNNLIRKESYLIVVLISNGRDQQVEQDIYGNGQTVFNGSIYNSRLASFRSLKASLNSIQLRLFSITAQRPLINSGITCPSGWRYSDESYKKMANQLYQDSGASDNNSNKDAFNLCQSSTVSTVFTSINSSIQQVVLPHQYSYWPITFAENNESVDLNEIRVHKVTSGGTSTELTRDSQWFYEGGSVRTVNTRTGPNPTPGPGEPVQGKHFVRFATPIVYPDCVLVTSISRKEYFGYIVLPQKPRIDTVVVRINGQLINKSSTNGWSDETSVVKTDNIKVPYPNAGDQNPPVVRTGYMLKLNGSSNYYKSGDNVEVNYIPEGI